MRTACCSALVVALFCCVTRVSAQEPDSGKAPVRTGKGVAHLAIGVDYGAGTLHGEGSGKYFAVTLDGTSRRGRAAGLRLSWMTGGDGYFALTAGLDRSGTWSGPRPWGRLDVGLLLESEFAGVALLGTGGVEIPLRVAVVRAGVLAGWHGTVPGPIGAFAGIRL